MTGRYGQVGAGDRYLAWANLWGSSDPAAKCVYERPADLRRGIACKQGHLSLVSVILSSCGSGQGQSGAAEGPDWCIGEGGNQDSKTVVFSCLMLSAFDIFENSASWKGNLHDLCRATTGEYGQIERGGWYIG
jgi:hypothetical protein